MATYLSDQLTEGFRRYPVADHGKFRIQYFSVSALAVAYASGDQIDLFKLPPGRKRILLNASRITTSAWGASRTLSLGTRAYSSRPPDNAQEAEAGTVFLNALDVSSAVAAAAWSTLLKYDLYSLAEIGVFATIGGGTMPIGASLSGYCTYISE